ncbi:unnamed protein product [Trichobilharzia szidati]|nr:unnamed protein product [Trichobilharzia szidati]
MPTKEQGEEVKSQIWKEIDCIRSGDLKTMNLRHALSRWHEVLVKKLECGRNFNRVITNCSEKIHSLTLNLQPAESMDTVDCVEIEKRLLHLQVIMNQTDKMLYDLQTIDFRTSISHSIKFINLVNQLIVLRQQNIVQRVLYNRLKYYLSELQNPSTFHRRLLHLFKLGTEGCRQITSELMRILNFTGAVDDATYCDDKSHESSVDYQYLEKPLFKMQIKSPGQSGLEQLFCKLSLVDKYCSEAQSHLSQKFSWFPLKSGSFNNQYEPMIGSDGSDIYLNELTNQLVISLLCPSVVKTKIETLSGESEKLRNILSAFADSTNEMNAFRDQLCIAIPQLTGYHLTNLSKAVDELELWANSRLNESHCPMDPVEKRHPQLGAQLKHAGQRLMELETCLEHSREAANILKFFEHETQIWSSTLSPSSSLTGKRESSQEVARKRGLLLQSNFESSPVACRLHTAWMKLTQLGDRLGRIQAGLPVRPCGENGTQVWVNNDFSTPTRYAHVVSSKVEKVELQVSPPILPPRPSPPSHRHISPVQTQSNLPTNLRSRLIKNEVNRNARWNKDDYEFPYNVISAEKLRRRQTNLRDALGSHKCVYPDCKESREECLHTHVGGRKKEMNIEDKIEYIFRKIINLHACLQKDYNESYHHEVYQRRMSSISKSELNRLVRHSCRRRWHNSYSLKSDYEELKILIDELMNSEYPKITKLQECFKSLEDLWFGTTNSRENLNRRVNRSRSRSRVSNEHDEHDYNSIESIYEDVRGNAIEFRQYIQHNGTYFHSTISPPNPTAPAIPHTYDSVSSDYETPHTQKPCQSYKDKDKDNLSNEEFCDWTWREIRNHGSDAQPLVFPSSEEMNRTHLTVSVAKSQYPCDTKVVPSSSQTHQFSKTPDFHSATTPSEKVSINTSEDSSENAPGSIKSGIPVHAKNTAEVHVQKIKLLPLNTVDPTLRSTSPTSIRRDWLSQPNRTISETPRLNKDEKHCENAYQSDEIHSYYTQPGAMTDSAVVTTTGRIAYLDSITPTSKINAIPQYGGLDPSYKNKDKPPSTSPIPPDGHIKPKPTNIELCVNKPAAPDVSNHVSSNKYISSSLVDSTVSREVILEVTDVSSSKNLNLDHNYRSTQTNFINSDKQPSTVSTDSSKTENSVNGISTTSQHKVNSDIPSSNSYSSLLTMTTTTVNINLLQHKSLENKQKSSEVTNSRVPSDSCITTSKAESVPYPSSSPSSSFSLPTYSSLYNSTRRAFHQIYQCRHLDTSPAAAAAANENVVDDDDATDRSINSMCDLCQHMTNLHTLISILQSHLLSNRQNRLCNLLPVDIESFTQTASSISSLSTYWSPIIKEYLTIIHEIKSELNSFQSSSSYLECKIVHLPEYKSMDDLLNIWQCRLQDFLCLRSSIDSTSGVNIPQTRWLTLFISLIQHNEIQVEYLKSVFTSLIHFIQNDYDYDESSKSELEANNTDNGNTANNDHNPLSNSYASEVVQTHDHSQNIRYLPTERLRISLKHEYLDDLKSRLFSHDLVDQQTITSPIQLFPPCNSSLLTLPTVNFTPSLRSKTGEEGNAREIPTTVVIPGVHEKKNDKDEESQTSPKLHSSGAVSFEQQTPNFHHQIVTHNKGSSTEPFTDEIPSGRSIQKTETVEESKDNCSETNWITVRRGKQKKAKKRKYKNEDCSKGKNSNRTEKIDNADHKDPHQPDHSVTAPELMQISHVDENQITIGDNQLDSSLYLRTSTPVSETLSNTSNQIYSQQFHEAKIHTAENVGSELYRGVSRGGESKRTDNLIGENNLREDSKPGANDTEADGRVREEENTNHTNKSDDLASWISMQSDSSPSVTDLNMVFGVNTVEDKECRAGDFLKSPSEDNNPASIKYATEETAICSIFKSDVTDNCKTTLTPVITSPPVEFDTPLKSGYHLERNKKRVQDYEHSTGDTHFKSSELRVPHETGGKEINSSGAEHKNKPFQSKKHTKVGLIQNDDHKVLNKEILSENERQFPSTEANRSRVSKDDDEGGISALVNISNTSKNNFYSNVLENDTDGGQSLKSKTPGSANDDSLSKNVIKVSDSNITVDASSPSSPVSTSNEPIHDSNKVPPSKRRTRKTNRKGAVSRHLNKRLMANNLEPTAIVDQSSKYHAAARGVSIEHTSMSLKSKQHSESDSDATPNSSLTRTIPTSEVPTTISLRPAWSESYHSSFTSDKDKMEEEINSAAFQQHEDSRTKQACLPPTGTRKCTISFDETNESSSNILSPTEQVLVGPSRLPEGNLSNYEFEAFNKSMDRRKYPLSSKDENIDLEQNVYKQRKQLDESRKRITKLSQFYQNESLKKGKNNDSVSRSHHCHDNNDDNDDDDSSNNIRYDQHEFHSERRNPQLTYEVENVYVLRQIPFKKQGEFQNELSADSRNVENTIQHSDRIHSSSHLFSSEKRKSDSFLNDDDFSQLKRQQVISTSETEEDNLQRREELINAKKSTSKRRCCRLLPWLLLLLPLLFLFFALLCTFVIPGCPLLLPWFICDERSPTGEWIYSTFVVFRILDPPL